MKKIIVFSLILILSWGIASAIEIVRQKNVATFIFFPIVDADGDIVTSAAGLDSEIDAWVDGSPPDGFTDCTNEATEIGSDGAYYLSLTQAEMNVDYIYVQIKTSTEGAKTQHLLIRMIDGDPLKLATVTSNYTIDVASTGEVGVDFSNINGTLDAGEFGADFITAAKIADDAFEYGMFAATAPGAWWNEGKTGYTVSTVGDKTGYKLAADGLDADTSFDQVQGKTDALPSDPCDDSDIDAQLLAIDNYVDTEVAEILDTLQVYDDAGHLLVDVQAILDTLQTYDEWIAALVDSINNAIADANKENFKGTGSSKITGMDAAVYDTIGANTADSIWLADSVDYFATDGTMGSGTVLQGAAAGLTKEQVAVTVRDTADNRPDIWTDQSAGTGSELCSLLLIDSNSQAVSGLSWTVKDSVGNVLGIANTNAAGWATFNIDQHDSVHAYPTERAGIDLATYYAEPVPSGGFCDTITATIWNYTVAGGGMCNIHINTRDLERHTTGYGSWKMTVEFSEPAGYVDTTSGILQGFKMVEKTFVDSGLMQVSVPQTWRCLLWDSVSEAYTDSGLYNIRIYRGDKMIKEFFKINVPRDSTQYDLVQLMK